MTSQEQAKEMVEFTRSNPGCYHSMIKYLSDLTGIPVRKEIYFNSVRELVRKKMNGKTELIYRRRDIFVEKDGKRYWSPIKRQIKGGGIIIQTSDNTEFPVGTKWDKIGVFIERRAGEFDIKINEAGKYQDSLGGGWSQTVAMYRINDNYFADMDCACR